MDLTATLAEAVVAAPDKSLKLLPGGTAHAELLTPSIVGTGVSKKTVSAYAITGLSNTPIAVWFDRRGKFFALIAGLSWLHAGYESR